MKKKRIVLAMSGLIVLLMTACNLSNISTPEAVPGTESTESTASMDPLVLPTETTAAAASVTPSVSSAVIITAESGSLSIRRGPSTYYNVLGYLQIGQNSIATARDTSGDWLYVAIPSNPTASGWVAAATQYSSVQGDINSLEVKTVGAAQAIIIRNCTYHPMLITPINLLLSPQNEAPNNAGSVAPGDYAAYDQSVGNTQVKTMSLVEGDTVIISTDGLGNTYSCP
jgi:hypothetical protein